MVDNHGGRFRRPVAGVFEDEKPGGSGGFGCLDGLLKKSIFETASC